MTKLIRFFPATNEVDAWDVYSQTWTGRVSAVAVFLADAMMASLAQPERRRIARMAARRGHVPAAYWWAQHATSHADKIASRPYQR